MQVMETTRTRPLNFSPLAKRYTLEEFFALPDPGNRAHYDLIGGFLFMVPPPDPPHGSFDARLARLLHNHLHANKVPGEVHHPREGIYIDEHTSTYLEPDMMYISKELSEKMGRKRTSADIVFEYLSASTANYDRTTKTDTYLLLGVRELWLIDPIPKTIEVRNSTTVENLPAWRGVRYFMGESAESEVLPGWRVSVDEIFEGLV